VDILPSIGSKPPFLPALLRIASCPLLRGFDIFPNEAERLGTFYTGSKEITAGCFLFHFRLHFKVSLSAVFVVNIVFH